MKKYLTLLEQYPSSEYRLIEHEWGQSPANVYNQIVDAWNELPLGGRVFFLSRKKYGLKSTLAFLKEQGIVSEIVGKGEEDVRMAEVIKTIDAPLEKKAPHNLIDFQFENKDYHVNVGNAVFSKTGLDEGTRFLLETFVQADPELNNASIGDLGAGWGAISLVLATEFPQTKIVAFEKEIGAFEALQENVKDFKNIEIFKTDILKKGFQIEKWKGQLDYIVSNFSFHISAEERETFFKTVSALLKPQGEIFFVTEGKFVPRFEQTAQASFKIIDTKQFKGYAVFRCKK